MSPTGITGEQACIGNPYRCVGPQRHSGTSGLLCPEDKRFEGTVGAREDFLEERPFVGRQEGTAVHSSGPGMCACLETVCMGLAVSVTSVYCHVWMV